MQPQLDPKIIHNRARDKWVKEFKYFRATATGSLARFMDFVTYDYMIDNILVRRAMIRVFEHPADFQTSRILVCVT